jgi:ribosomal protein S18 acetylase RimI-like enzyme
VADWTLRPARPDDADVVADIWHRGWRDGHVAWATPELLAQRSLADFRRRVPALVPVTTVAELEGVVVGFVMVHDDELEQMYVDRPARGTGLAAALIAAAEASIASHGYDLAWLAVIEENPRARRFYERSGWRDTGLVDYPAQTETGAITVRVCRYEKRLRGPSD